MMEVSLETLREQSTTHITRVPAESISMLWPRVLDILYRKGKKWLEIVDEEDIHRLLCSGEADLWCAMQDGRLKWFGVCMIERHARASYYHVCFVGGEGFLQDLSVLLPLVEQHACMVGARELVFEARRGFGPVMKKYGYGATTLRLRKNVRVLWSN